MSLTVTAHASTAEHQPPTVSRSVPTTATAACAEALEGIASFQATKLRRAVTLNDGLLYEAAFYAPNWVRRAVLAAGISAEPALTAVSFLTDFFQTAEGQRYTPCGRVRLNVIEEVR